MSPTVLNVLVLVVATAAIGWCVWHCVRGMQRMRKGQTASCCPPGKAGDGDVAAQLAQLRDELQQLKSGRHDTTAR